MINVVAIEINFIQPEPTLLIVIKLEAQVPNRSINTWLTNVMPKKLVITFLLNQSVPEESRRLLLLRFTPRVTAGRLMPGRETLGAQTLGGVRHRLHGGNQANGDVLPGFWFLAAGDRSPFRASLPKFILIISTVLSGN